MISLAPLCDTHLYKLVSRLNTTLYRALAGNMYIYLECLQQRLVFSYFLVIVRAARRLVRRFPGVHVYTLVYRRIKREYRDETESKRDRSSAK